MQRSWVGVKMAGSKSPQSLSSAQSAMWDTWVRSLRWEDPLEKGKATYPLQYSGLENSMDCIVHGVTKSDTTE